MPDRGVHDGAIAAFTMGGIPQTRMRTLNLFGALLVGCGLAFTPGLSGATLVINEDFNTPVVGYSFNGLAYQDVAAGNLRLATMGLYGYDNAGSVYATAPVHVERFTASFDFQITGSHGDGLVFAVLAPPSGPTYLGNGGANFGWGPFPTGFGVEFDIYNNGVDGLPADTNDNHVGLDVAGMPAPYGAINSVAVAPVAPRFLNGGLFSARIEFDDGTVDLFLSNPGIGFAETLVLHGVVPGFSPFDGFFGFGGSGMGASNITVDNFRVDIPSSPVPEPSTLLIAASGFATWGAMAWRRHHRG